MGNTKEKLNPSGMEQLLSRLLRRLDAFSGWVVAWLVVVMIAIGAFNALARYSDRFTGWGLSSNFYLELQWYLFAVVFFIGAGWTLAQDAHVRVDVLYSRLTVRGRAWVDFLGGLLFLLPFCIFSLIIGWPSVRESWRIGESSPDPDGLARYPIKTLPLIAFALLLLQGLRMTWAAWRTLRSSDPAPGSPGVEPTARRPSLIA